MPAQFDVYLDDTNYLQASGFETQIAQDVTLDITSLNDILAHPNESPAITIQVSGTIVMTMRLYSGDVGDENCYLLTKFAAFEPGPTPVLVPGLDPKNNPLPFGVDQFIAVVNTYLKGLIPDATVPVPVFSQLPGHPAKTQATNAGVSVDANMTRIAFRFQVVVPALNADTPWTEFFSGNFENALGGQQWSLSVDSGYLVQAVKLWVGQGLAGAQTDQFDVYVDASYSNPGGAAIITTSIEGVVHLPWPLPDQDLNLSVPLILSVPDTDIIQLDVKIQQLKDIAEEIAGPYLTILQWVLPILGTIISIIAESAIDSIQDPSLPGDCQRTGPDDIICKSRLPITSVLGNLVPHVKTLVALDDKVALAGSVYESALTVSALNIEVNGFRFTPPPVSCNAADQNIANRFGVGANSPDVLIGKAFLTTDGTVPLYLCGFTVLNDRFGVFPASKVTTVSSSGAVVELVVHIPPPGDAYDASPYPCELLVATTGGTRLVSIPPPPAFNSAAQKELRDSAIIQIANCEKLMDPWFRHFGKLNTQTFTDPPRDPTSSGRLWSVEVDGLPAGEFVTLLDAVGHEIVRVTARQDQPVRISALTPYGRAAGEKGISIVHGRPPAENAKSVKADSRESTTVAKRGLGLVQQAIISAGSIPLPQRCTAIQNASVAGDRRLLALLKDSILAFDFSNPQTPRLTDAWAKPGVSGAANFAGQLALFGQDGPELISPYGKRVAAPDACSAEVAAAAVTGEYIYAAVPDELRTYNQRLCCVSRLELEGLSAIIFAGGALVAAHKNQLSIYSIANPRRPRQAGATLSLGGEITRLCRSLDGPSHFTALLADGSAVSFLVTSGGMEPVARFRQTPWKIGSLQIGTMLVRVSKCGSKLIVSRLGARMVGAQNAPTPGA